MINNTGTHITILDKIWQKSNFQHTNSNTHFISLFLGVCVFVCVCGVCGWGGVGVGSGVAMWIKGNIFAGWGGGGGLGAQW